ncbi:MAG: right-handed parallel beta-helix repeat-containing protein [Candidatus Cloacimonetes bacterium]|nr:right-handed parallel beta-helix repeat-containing protein [Candidatus Cloacimonadota bacterium]
MLKKSLFLLIINFVIFYGSIQALNHSGVINTEIWTLSDSPHIITGNVTVTDGETLTIEPDCIVKFDNDLYIQIQGALIADGKSDSLITFTSNQTIQAKGDWRYIYFNGADVGSILDYCDITYGGNFTASVYITGSGTNVSISNCNVTESNTNGIFVDNGSLSTISDCSISNCYKYPISLYANCAGNISGSMNFVNNGPVTPIYDNYDGIKISANNVNFNSTWQNIGFPFFINGDITIIDGVALTIEPGCDLRFNGNYQIQVLGTLIANGTLADSITFTSNQIAPDKGDWKYIYFNDADTGSILNYCNISYGGSNSGELYIHNSGSNVTISNCNIDNSGSSGIYIHSSSTPSIADCKIENNTTYGIYSYYATGVPLISNCIIQNNGSYAIRVFADNLKNITGTMNITGNTNNSIFVDGGTVYTGTWQNHNVPYIIGGNVTVNNAETLTIEEGSILKFETNCQLQVLGTLVANATESYPITFTSNQATPNSGDWRYIYFNAADAGSVLNYCNISYGGSNGGNIYISNSGSNVTISNCNIDESGSSGINVYSASTPFITYCTIENSATYGIYSSYATGNPLINNCIIQNNGSYAIRVSANNLNNITGIMDITENTNNSIFADAGTVNTCTWQNHNVPYVIGGNVTVNNGETLTIEEGNTLKFETNFYLQVFGALIANGTSTNHISFTSNQQTPAPGNWKYIFFNGSDPGTILNYCNISYGGVSAANIYVYNSGNNVTISNCIIENSGTLGIYVYLSSYPNISDCTIQNNNSYAIQTPANNVKNITGTMNITGNVNNSIFVEAGTIYTGTWLNHNVPYVIDGDITINNGDTLTIEEGNTIKFNEGKQLQVIGALVAEGTELKHITFTSNQEIPNSGYWKYIYFNSADPGCSLSYCDISYGGISSGNIILNNSGNNVTISNCLIEESGTIGIYAYNNSNPNISDCTIQNNDNYAIRTLANSVKNITGTMNIAGNEYNSIFVDAETIYTGTWLYHNVPYVIGGDVTINDGNTLTINEGNTLKFNGSFHLQVLGTLIADGTDANHITFTSNQEIPNTGDWRYIYFNGADAGCSLSYCEISYGGSSTANIYINNSNNNISISNCEIKESANSGLYLANNSNPTISNSVINNNDTYGVYSSTTTSNHLISDCVIQENGSYAIYFPANALGNITGTMNITGNTHNSIFAFASTVYTSTWLNHNAPYVIGGDVTINNGDTLTIEEGNTLKFNGPYHLHVLGTLIANGTETDHITFTSNQETPASGDWRNIYYNSADTGCSLTYCDIFYGGSSTGNIYMNNSTNNISISHCEIKESATTGLYISNNSASSIKNCVISDNQTQGIHIADGSIPTFGNNIDEWNDIFDNGQYNFYNGSSDIDVGYVYWGTVSSNEIDANIYDDSDNSIYGIVNYEPWTNSNHSELYNLYIQSPANVLISITAYTVYIIWDSVSDATSYKVYSSDDPYSGFLEDTTGTFVDESWSAPVLLSKKFFYVKAVN